MPSSAYFAGFFDADGSVGIYASRKHLCGEPQYRLQTTVAQNSTPILEAFAAQFGGTVRQARSMKGRFPNGRVSWYWRVSGDLAFRFLAVVESHLIVKREQAQLGLQFQALVQEAKHLPRNGPDRVSGERKMELIRQRAECHLRMKELKHGFHQVPPL
jgi:hypothetical protein